MARVLDTPPTKASTECLLPPSSSQALDPFNPPGNSSHAAKIEARTPTRHRRNGASAAWAVPAASALADLQRRGVEVSRWVREGG